MQITIQSLCHNLRGNVKYTHSVSYISLHLQQRKQEHLTFNVKNIKIYLATQHDTVLMPTNSWLPKKLNTTKQFTNIQFWLNTVFSLVALPYFLSQFLLPPQ